MTIDRGQKYGEMVARGKYRKLYAHLCNLGAQEWSASFSEIESLLGFELPASARLHRPWWGNQSNGNGHSQSLAWTLAGWETAHVDMDAETLLLRKRDRSEGVRKPRLNEWWPPHPTARWPEGLSLRREDMYEERV